MSEQTATVDDVSGLYPLWIKNARAEARALFNNADKSLSSLQNIGSTYWRSVKAMRDLRKQVLDILNAAPDELSSEPLAASPAVQAVPTWQPIETAPKGRKIVVGYPNRLGKWRTVIACYYLPQTLQREDEFDGDDDDGYAPEGWYEESETQDGILPTDEAPTHWQPLPAAPIQRPGDHQT
jgi:hypothetical protein